MIPADTPYKIIKYLVKLSKEGALTKNHLSDKFIIYLTDRKFIIETTNSKNKFTITESFKKKYSNEIYPIFQKCNSFIKKHQIENLENYYSVDDMEKLILIDIEKPTKLSLQEILSKYFKSSKHTRTNSNLANAIKTILKIDEFVEDKKDQQFISVLYPKNKTRFIILCENINRLRAKRHTFIEFWYAGGKNTKQLQFIPKPKHPIFYLFDWDFDGLNIYIHIKQNYFQTLTAFIPTNFQSLMEKREEVKHHHSKWKNNNALLQLNEIEKTIATLLIQTDCIIEEQKILLTTENLNNNSIK